MKKAQMIGQIFTYVLSILLIGLILIYGYNAITTFREKSEQVTFVKFKNDLSNMVEIISPDYGSVKIRDFEVPGGYNKVCFVENFPAFPSLSNTGYPIIEDSVRSKVKKNVFLVEQRAEKSFFIGDISVENDILCFEVINNVVKVRFEGKGDHALLAET